MRSMWVRFIDRRDAGRKLVPLLEKYKDKKDVIIIGLPRGGVVNAYEVAKELNLPLDIIVVRKIGAPMQPEFAVGAISQEGDVLLDHNIMNMVGVKEKDLQIIIADEKQEAKRRLELYRGDRAPLDLANKTVILVDDGLATGATMRAAILSARRMGAQKIIVAIPVSPKDTLKKIEQEADEVVCLYTPDVFWGVGGFYDVFYQTEDNKVIDLLSKSK